MGAVIVFALGLFARVVCVGRCMLLRLGIVSESFAWEVCTAFRFFGPSAEWCESLGRMFPSARGKDQLASAQSKRFDFSAHANK